jgi:hypothetical protein
VPSFAAPRTAPLGAPSEKPEGVFFPPAVDRLAAVEAASTPAPVVPVASSPTRIHFAGELATRALARNPALSAPQMATAPVGRTVLLAGVNGDGEIRYQILQQSCGDAKLDNLAIGHLRRLAFTPGAAPIIWAHVTFAWGADAYDETAASVKPPPVP